MELLRAKVLPSEIPSHTDLHILPVGSDSIVIISNWLLLMAKITLLFSIVCAAHRSSARWPKMCPSEWCSFFVSNLLQISGHSNFFLSIHCHSSGSLRARARSLTLKLINFYLQLIWLLIEITHTQITFRLVPLNLIIGVIWLVVSRQIKLTIAQQGSKFAVGICIGIWIVGFALRGLVARSNLFAWQTSQATWNKLNNNLFNLDTNQTISTTDQRNR